MRAGQMPEPTVGTNMPECRWPETKSWWYRRTFEVDADFVAHERQALVFDGLDLYAQVFVNGQLAGEAANAFVPATFEVKRLLRAGENELVVRLTSGSELAKDTVAPPNQVQPGNHSQAGSRRSAQSNERRRHHGPPDVVRAQMAAQAAVHIRLGLGGCAAQYRHLARRAVGRAHTGSAAGPAPGHPADRRPRLLGAGRGGGQPASVERARL